MDAASDLHAPISACRFDVPVQFSRKLRPFRPPVVPSSVRVSQNFLTQMDAASGLLLCSCCSGVSIPRSCTLRSPIVPASAVCTRNFLANWMPLQHSPFALSSDIPQHTVSVAGLQFCPPQCAQAKISALNGCRSRISTFTFQCNVPATLPFSSDPMGRPFEYFICFPLRLPAEAARHSKPAPNSVSATAPAAALHRSNLCHGLSPQI